MAQPEILSMCHVDGSGVPGLTFYQAFWSQLNNRAPHVVPSSNLEHMVPTIHSTMTTQHFFVAPSNSSKILSFAIVIIIVLGAFINIGTTATRAEAAQIHICCLSIPLSSQLLGLLPLIFHLLLFRSMSLTVHPSIFT